MLYVVHGFLQSFSETRTTCAITLQQMKRHTLR